MKYTLEVNMKYYEVATRWWVDRIGKSEATALFRQGIAEAIKNRVEQYGEMELITEDGNQSLVYCIAQATGVNAESVPSPVNMKISKGSIKVKSGNDRPFETIFYART